MIGGQFGIMPGESSVPQAAGTLLSEAARNGGLVTVKTDKGTFAGHLYSTSTELSTGLVTLEIAFNQGEITINNVHKDENEEYEMSRFTAEVIPDNETKTAKIYLNESGTENYLVLDPDDDEGSASDLTQVEVVVRKPGEKMPVFATVPEEYFLPILAAAKSAYGH